jgi:hypothetical protein
VQITLAIKKNRIEVPQETRMRLDVVVYTCNPSCLGCRDQENHVPKTPSTNKNLGAIVCIFHPSYTENLNRRIETHAGLGINVRAYTPKSKEGWDCGSSGRVPA